MWSNSAGGITKSLKFLPQLTDRVSRVLNRVDAKFRERRGLTRDAVITYVGVHNRRTDYTKYVEFKFGMEELGEEFFEKGMEMFR